MVDKWTLILFGGGFLATLIFFFIRIRKKDPSVLQKIIRLEAVKLDATEVFLIFAALAIPALLLGWQLGVYPFVPLSLFLPASFYRPISAFLSGVGTASLILTFLFILRKKNRQI